MCFLLKIAPQKGAAFGVTTLDIDVPYDDGGGLLTYAANPGLNQSAVEKSAGLGVDNAEAMLLLGVNFTAQQINAGVLDNANFYLYRINWKNKSQGHYLLQSGRAGAVRSHDELSGVIELRGLSQQLKQNFIDQYSLSCRARFGSQVGDEIFPCLFDAEPLWTNSSVAAVGTEADRIFTATAAPTATGPNGALPFDFAVIEFLTGDNAGLTVETETVVGTAITLRFQSAYNMVIGDTYRIRPDCEKRYVADCINLFDNGLNFRGEPWIPITEESGSQTPGANISGLGAPAIANTAGTTSFESFFGIPFLTGNVDVTKIIPDEGIAILFTVPITSQAFKIRFLTIEVATAPTARTGAVNSKALDFTTPPTFVWGLGGDISGGINFAGEDIDLIPGSSYIFNVKNNTIQSPNWANIRVTTIPK